MKIYTQGDFDNFPVINGRKQCPTGDYRDIYIFYKRCSFGRNCIFGSGCKFGADHRFDDGCSFGDGCSFLSYCIFGSGCVFGDGCAFDEDCSFGDACIFKNECVFLGRCVFRGCCSFENGHNARMGYPILTFGGFGSENRTMYFFNCVDGIFVRCGCFSGYIDQFREQVKITREGEIANEYLEIADLVERKWKNEI